MKACPSGKGSGSGFRSSGSSGSGGRQWRQQCLAAAVPPLDSARQWRTRIAARAAGRAAALSLLAARRYQLAGPVAVPEPPERSCCSRDQSIINTMWKRERQGALLAPGCKAPMKPVCRSALLSFRPISSPARSNALEITGWLFGWPAGGRPPSAPTGPSSLHRAVAACCIQGTPSVAVLGCAAKRQPRYRCCLLCACRPALPG